MELLYQAKDQREVFSALIAVRASQLPDKTGTGKYGSGCSAASEGFLKKLMRAPFLSTKQQYRDNVSAELIRAREELIGLRLTPI